MNSHRKFYLLMSVLSIILVASMIFDWWSYLLILLSTFLIMYSALLIHEIGHMIAGLFLKYEFQYLIIGPLIIINNEKITIHFNGNKSIWGQCAMFPTFKDYETSRKEYMYYLAAGSGSNAVIFLFSVIMYFITGHLLWIVLAISHLFMGGVAFIPVKAEGVYYTDGLSFLILLKNNDTSKLYFNLLQISYALTFFEQINRISPHKIEEIEKETFEQIDRHWLQNEIHQELFIYLLYELGVWNFIAEKYQKCVDLLEPLTNKEMSNRLLKQELITIYLYAKQASGQKVEFVHTNIMSGNSAFSSITNLKMSALAELLNHNLNRSLKTLDLAIREIKHNKYKMHGEAAEIAVINKMKKIVEHCQT
ncbi:hypothetical protein [Parageobacillus toebii]|uniref:Peptidase M50 domain-containing protein n=1 Tax=Parageobacillus toebii TaxID=153151 RepID=A0A150MU59_9BACL|nr:hypothetical protein [Parageobacillus toebii]KYD27964.1 hypothetical protein B4110_3742 [Parageobacillus toebii]